MLIKYLFLVTGFRLHKSLKQIIQFFLLALRNEHITSQNNRAGVATCVISAGIMHFVRIYCWERARHILIYTHSIVHKSSEYKAYGNINASCLLIFSMYVVHEVSKTKIK